MSEFENKDLPEFNEASWEKMEALLDKHLPQEKKRRRFFFFLLFGLLTGGGIAALLIITINNNNNPAASKKIADESQVQLPGNNNSGKKETSSAVNNDKKIPGSSNTEADYNQPAAKNDAIINNTREQVSTGANSTLAGNDTYSQNASLPQRHKEYTGNDNKLPVPLSVPNKNQRENIAADDNKSNMAIAETTANTSAEKREIKNKMAVSQNKEAIAEKPVESAAKDAGIVQAETSSGSTNDITAEENKTGANKKQEIHAQADSLAKEPIAVENKKTGTDEKKLQPDSSVAAVASPGSKKEKDKKQKGNKFAVSFSAGPDISAVGTKPGQWKIQYGVGISYAVSNRFTVRTGFYIGNKVYSADSNSYHTAFNSMGPYYKLDKVEGSCRVFEIPLTVTYSFAKSKNHNWFAATGLSSYLMNTEDYVCTYKDTWSGGTYKYDYSYNNKNNHLFSVLNLSGGYQYNFSNRFSFMAEPYVKIPLTGVGFGKVKLNSAGVLFTLGYKPFLKPGKQ